MATVKQLAALKKARAERKKSISRKTVERSAGKYPVTSKAESKKKSTVRKRNPEKRAVTAKYCIAVTTAGGKHGYVNKAAGDIVLSMDTDAEKAKPMLLGQAERIAQKFFDKHKRYLRKVAVVAIKKPHDAVYRANPVPASKALKVKEAAFLYEDFTGHEAEFYENRKVDLPDVALQFGKCDGIMYETVRDGVVEHYVHKFKKSARPVIAASHDGKNLLLVGGNYRFTNRGIVDN